MARASHPSIVPIHDSGEVDGRPYLVMEYVEGGDLRRLMPEGQTLTPQQVRAIVLPVGDALAYLHLQGIVHRDLKPENILLQDGQHPRVADFGIAILRGEPGSATETGSSVGTLGYVAPEQRYRLKVDGRADQYSLAAICYEMLTGHLPLGVFQRPSELNQRIGLEVDSVIMQALREDAKDRFATMREFLAMLDLALSTPEHGPARSIPQRLALAALGVVVASAAIASFIAWSRHPQPAPAAEPRKDNPRAEVPRVAPAAPKIAKTPAPSSALSGELKKLRAYEIWKARGSPIGAAGEAVREEIALEAEQKLESELKAMAYGIWEENGSPSGAEGEALKEKFWGEAERRLYRKLTGKEWIEPAPR
jgi:serine/threonine protein kinase